MGKKKIFDLSAISIIVCDCLQAVVCIFVDLFLVAHILKYQGSSVTYNIFRIGMFYAIFYTVLSLSYLFSGYFLRKINKSIFVSIGSVGLCIVVLTIYLLGESLVTFIPLIAVMYGLSFAFFSSGYHNLTSETISSKYQVRFFAVKRIAFQATYIIFPVTLGLIIDKINFSFMALIMVALCIALVVFSFLIKPKRIYKQSFNIPKYCRYLKNNKESTKPIKFVLISNYFRGASYDCFTTLITILVWSVLQSNTYLGTLQSVFTLCSLATMFIYLRYYRKKRAKGFIIPTIVLVSLAVVGIIATLGTNLVFIIIFYAVYSVLNVILMSISDSRRASVARTLSLHSHILENTAISELSLGAGRVTSSIFLMLAGLFDGLVGEGTVFLLLTIAIVCVMYIFYGISLIFVEKSLIDQDDLFHKVHANEIIEEGEK